MKSVKSSELQVSIMLQRVHACRRELVAYDKTQLEQSRGGRSGSIASCSSRQEPVVGGSANVGRCFGCASAATEHCLTLLRALAVTPSSRKVLCAQGLIQELVEFNLRKGTVQVSGSSVGSTILTISSSRKPTTNKNVTIFFLLQGLITKYLLCRYCAIINNKIVLEVLYAATHIGA